MVLLQTDGGHGIELVLKLSLRARAVSKGERAVTYYLQSLEQDGHGRPILPEINTSRKLFTGAFIHTL